MRTLQILGAAMAVSYLLASCKGDKGDLGPAGKNSLTKTTMEAAGSNCANGGVKIESGIDANSNGTLENSEVISAQTRYICNGAAGSEGPQRLVKVSPEASTCRNGGVVIETGVDANKNGILDVTEVVPAMTQYICNGQTGVSTLIKTSAEPAGANCTYGGTKFESGLDQNRNGMLDESEILNNQTRYVCNGAGAIASNWIDLHFTQYEWRENDPLEEVDFNLKQVIPVPQLTAEMTDKGAVLVYFKNSENKIFPLSVAGNWQMPDVYSPGPGQESIWVWKAIIYNFVPGEIKLLSDKGDTEPIAWYNETGAAVRYVLIPGISGGRIAELQKMSYEDVVKLYNIR